MSGRGVCGLPSRRASDADWSVVARRFGDALRTADGRHAQATARQALAGGLSVAGVHARVITPAMHWIGRLWEQQAITIADEHLASAISHRVLASLYTALDGDAPARNATVVLAAPAGQHHGLGLQMAADVLEDAGYRVIHLGIDVPTDALAATVAEHEPAVAGLSLTMPLGTRKLEEAMAAIADVRPDTHILLGGQGVPRRLIDDGIPYVPSVESLVREVQRLTEGDVRPATACPRAAPVLQAPVTSGEAQGIGTAEDRMLHATIEMGDVVRDQARLTAHFRSLAFHDHLSGLPNRRAFDDRFAELSAGDAAPRLAVIMLDLDGFKQINDRFGHDEGDKALIIVSDALRRVLRAGDFPARFGGDEFAALLPAIEPDSARRVAARLQHEALALSGPLELKLSVGIAWFDGDHRRTLLRADGALYEAKTRGRNLVCLAEAGDSTDA